MSPPNIISLSQRKLHLHSHVLNPVPTPSISPTCITSSSSSIAEASSNGSVQLRDAHSLESVRIFPSEPSSVSALALSETHLVAGHSDGTVALHNISANDHIIFNEASSIVDVVLPKDGRYLAAATASTIALFSTVSNRLITRLTQPQSQGRSYPRISASQARFTSLGFSPLHSPLLAATDDTGCVSIYDIAQILSSTRTHPLQVSTPTSSATHARFSSALRAPATALSFASDGHLAVVGFDKLLRIFHPSLKQLLFTVSLPSPISSVAFGNTVAVGLTDSSIALVSLDIPNSTGSVSKRVSIQSTPRSSGSLAVKAILFQPQPKRRKPSRTLTPISTPVGDPSVEEFLSSIDQLVDGDDDIDEGVSGQAFHDADIFSPIVKPNSESRLPESKSAYFRSLDVDRENATPRSYSDHNLSPQNTPRSIDSIRSMQKHRPNPRENERDWENVLTTPFKSLPSRRTPAVEDSSSGISHEEPLARNLREPSSASIGQSSATSSFVDALSGSPPLSTHTPVHLEARASSSSHLLPPPHPNPPTSTKSFRALRKESQSDIVISSTPVRVERKRDSEEYLSPRNTRENSKFELDKEPSSEESQVLSRSDSARDHEKDSKWSQLNRKAFQQQESSQSGLADEVKEVLRQELEALRIDLRSDILNIHTDMITNSARQSEELIAVVKERDALVNKLEEEITRLRSDNVRLRKKLGLA